MNFGKKAASPLAAPTLQPQASLSQRFAEAHDEVSRLEEKLESALAFGAEQEKRANTAEAVIEALKKEFAKIRQGQEEEMNTLRNHGDHWHHEALRYREGIRALAGPLKALLDAPAEYDTSPPKADPLAQPPRGLEDALLPPNREDHPDE